eukprot:14878133-Heterocapsa_arctica.AAC.1
MFLVFTIDFEMYGCVCFVWTRHGAVLDGPAHARITGRGPRCDSGSDENPEHAHSVDRGS